MMADLGSTEDERWIRQEGEEEFRFGGRLATPN